MNLSKSNGERYGPFYFQLATPFDDFPIHIAISVQPDIGFISFGEMCLLGGTQKRSGRTLYQYVTASGISPSIPQVYPFCATSPCSTITTHHHYKKKKTTMMLLMTQTSQTEHSNVLDSIQPLALPRMPKPSEHLSRSQKACPLPD